MRQLLLAAFLTLFLSQQLAAQSVLPQSRRVDWSKAGYGGTIPSYPQVSILNFGADNTGNTASNNALTAAINGFFGAPGTIFFPAGNYLFNQAVTLPPNIVLKGAGSTQTQLTFNLGGAYQDLISIRGTMGTAIASITTGAAKDATEIQVNNAADFEAGDYIRLSQNDAALVTSIWAVGSVGQIVQIDYISGNTIGLKTALRKTYTLAEAPLITKMNVQTGNGIECLKIKRLDATTGQTSNIKIEYAAKCRIRGVESDSSNFAHLAISTATNIEVSGCYFHGAFAYGGSGQGYGVVLESTSGECLVENNIFKHLRHSMLLQAGANGNVLAYNYSIEPFWTEPSFPSDAAGDMVLHGNWVYANLFEGNVGQTMTIDNSHGPNGWFNTYFRNRGASYGLVMNDGAGDSTNLIGNEITNPYYGFYNITGNGNLLYANNIKGTVTPAGTSALNDISLYRDTRPYYFEQAANYPPMGPVNVSGSGTIPATASYNSVTPCSCGTSLVILPITLKSFTATASACNALLQWTAIDAAGDRYTIESSRNGVDFTPVKTVAANGLQIESTYTSTIAQPDATNWYRLKLTGKDGTSTYSRLAAVSSGCRQQETVTIYPNPVSDVMQLVYHIPVATHASLQITNATGKIVAAKELHLQAGFNQLPVDVHALTAGIYYVQLYAAGTAIGTVQKVIKR